MQQAGWSIPGGANRRVPWCHDRGANSRFRLHKTSLMARAVCRHWQAVNCWPQVYYRVLRLTHDIRYNYDCHDGLQSHGPHPSWMVLLLDEPDVEGWAILLFRHYFLESVERDFFHPTKRADPSHQRAYEHPNLKCPLLSTHP